MKCMAPGRQCASLLSDPGERPYQFTYLAIHFGKIWKSWVVFFFHLCLPSCFSPLLKKPRIFLRSSKGEVVLRTHLAGFFEMYEWGSRTLHCGMNHFPLAPVQERFLETSHPTPTPVLMQVPSSGFITTGAGPVALSTGSGWARGRHQLWSKWSPKRVGGKFF